MNIILTEEAIEWFHKEMEAGNNDYIKFFARYGGSSPLHEGFSLGITKEQPDEMKVHVEQNGIHFYIEDRDFWYFDGHDLHVKVDPAMNELVYSYEKAR